MAISGRTLSHPRATATHNASERGIAENFHFLYLTPAPFCFFVLYAFRVRLRRREPLWLNFMYLGFFFSGSRGLNLYVCVREFMTRSVDTSVLEIEMTWQDFYPDRTRCVGKKSFFIKPRAAICRRVFFTSTVHALNVLVLFFFNYIYYWKKFSVYD